MSHFRHARFMPDIDVFFKVYRKKDEDRRNPSMPRLRRVFGAGPRKHQRRWTSPAMTMIKGQAFVRKVVITEAQCRWRNLLVGGMARQGFVNYAREWWHFSLPGAGGPAYDFPITPRGG
jgi:hypothetical protein